MMSATERLDLDGADYAGSERARGRPATVFGVALAIRLTVAAAFLGGQDGINGIAFMRVATAHIFINLPYFPLVPNWLGLAGVLDAQWIHVARVLHIHLTVLPPGIFPKLLPCVADSLVATWFSIDTRQTPRYRRISSWAYATCPLALLLACVQGQWDSIWILFSLPAIAIATQKDVTVKERWLAGALLGLGALFKPIPLILLPLLFPRWRDRVSVSDWLRSVCPSILALVITVFVFFLWFALEGIDLARSVRFVLRYSTTDTGHISFGLSQLAALNHFGDPAGVLRDVAILLAVAVIVQYHLTQQLKNPMATAAAVLLILPAVGGIFPQYLLWALPFMLAAGCFRLAIIYSSVSTFVVLAHYLIGKERLFFAPLRALRVLAVPSAARNWLSSAGPVAVWRPISNLAVPVFMLVTAFVLFRPRNGVKSHDDVVDRVTVRRSVALASGLVGIFVAAMLVYQLGPYPKLTERLLRFQQAQLQSYAVTRLYSVVTVGGGSWWFSVLWVIPMLTLAWWAILWRTCRIARVGA